MKDLISHPSILKQSWWHIEDYIEPSDGRIVVRVEDFYIEKEIFKKNNCIPIELRPYFIGFKVKNKNSDRELSFIEQYNNDEESLYSGAVLTANLGHCSDWPFVEDSNFLHIKIQYEYTEIWPIFLKRFTWMLGVKVVDENCRDYRLQLPKKLKGKINLFRNTGYIGQFIMSGFSQGEISITTPLGMNIKNKGKDIEIRFYNGPVNSDTENIIMKHCRPHISYYASKLKHHYIIDGKSYDKVLKSIDKNKLDQKVNFLVTYSVVNDMKFYVIPGFSILFLGSVLGIVWDNTNLFYFVIILFSLSTLYITLRKEKYQIPFNSFVFCSIPISVIFLILRLYYLYPTEFFKNILYIRSLIPF